MCPVCGKAGYETVEAILAHVGRRHPEVQVVAQGVCVCPICMKGYPDEAAMNGHIRRRHEAVLQESMERIQRILAPQPQVNADGDPIEPKLVERAMQFKVDLPEPYQKFLREIVKSSPEYQEHYV